MTFLPTTHQKQFSGEVVLLNSENDLQVQNHLHRKKSKSAGANAHFFTTTNIQFPKNRLIFRDICF